MASHWYTIIYGFTKKPTIYRQSTLEVRYCDWLSPQQQGDKFWINSKFNQNSCVIVIWNLHPGQTVSNEMQQLAWKTRKKEECYFTSVAYK